MQERKASCCIAGDTSFKQTFKNEALKIEQDEAQRYICYNQNPESHEKSKVTTLFFCHLLPKFPSNRNS